MRTTDHDAYVLAKHYGIHMSAAKQLTGALPNIKQRLDFMGLDAATRGELSTLEELLAREMPKALDSFYSKVRVTPETSRFFSSEKHLQGAKTAQVSHWTNIARGDFNEQYTANVRTIGTVHARIGLEPQWYIGGYAMIFDHLIKAAIKQYFPKTGLFAKRPVEPEKLGGMLGALAKAMLLDMDLAISVYIGPRSGRSK